MRTRLIGHPVFVLVFLNLVLSDWSLLQKVTVAMHITSQE